MQGQQPHTLFLDRPELEAICGTPPRIALGPFTLIEPETARSGWFQWGPVVERLRKE
jgi:hypothetical protein